jgi:RNA polymerase sigma factor (TIGR02999 family)
MTEGTNSQEITRLLLDWRSGKKAALDRLTPLVYQELRQIAVGHLRRDRSDHTLQPTALIHEAYLRMVGQDMPEWKSRTHFFGIAAHLMRQILVDHARKQGAAKRGAGNKKISLDEAVVFSEEKSSNLLHLDEALTRLSALDQRKAQVIEMRYFAGLSVQETSEALQISVATVGRDLRMAEAWLRRELTK